VVAPLRFTANAPHDHWVSDASIEARPSVDKEKYRTSELRYRESFSSAVAEGVVPLSVSKMKATRNSFGAFAASGRRGPSRAIIWATEIVLRPALIEKPENGDFSCRNSVSWASVTR
jgi:hypothetical protein